MVVADGSACHFPDMLLRIELGRSRREVHKLESGIGRQQRINRCTEMPEGAAPQYQDRLLWV